MNRRALKGFRKHPRSRGENDEAMLAQELDEETPPLARGKLDGFAGARRRLGNTPARAGKTLSRQPYSRHAWKHPRSRGENSARTAQPDGPVETPPLARGKRRSGSARPGCPGNTPARAGKTTARSISSSAARKHPRSRGENRRTASSRPSASETPPLARGKQQREAKPALMWRNTPARAGKTCAPNPAKSTAKKHPRSRGENLMLRARINDAAETPPLARGKPRRWAGCRSTCRNTPARAGKTCVRMLLPMRSQKHPRSRGENR